MLFRLSRTAALGAVLACVPSFAAAQNGPERSLRWGRIPAEDLALAAYPADSNAAAVVLGEVGKITYDDEGRVVFQLHRRVKLLKPAAYDAWATVELVTQRGERVEDVEGQTFVPAPGGEATRHGLGRSNVFRTDIARGLKSVKFTLPALEPGAVIEYRYKHVLASPYYLPAWSFQHGEPTRYSELRAAIPDALQFVTATQGFTPVDLVVKETDRVTGPLGAATEHRWAMADVPALREEPFMTTPEDFRRRMSFQLMAVNVPGWGTENLLTTWAKAANLLVGRGGSLDEVLRGDGGVEDQARALVAGKATAAEKMQALYDYVRSSIAYEPSSGWYPDRSVRDVLRSKRGTSPEVNLLLVALLRKAGLEAHPALLSSRDHGRVVTTFPLLDQFNDLVAAVALDGQTVLLDATNPLRPHTLLPSRSLNGQAWVAKLPEGQWVPIPARGGARSVTAVTATLDADGRLAGRAELALSDYAGLTHRAGLRDETDEAAYVRRAILGGADGLTLGSHAVHDRGVHDAPLRVEAAFEAAGYAPSGGDLLYVNPVVFGREEANPLRLPTRTFPVDLGYTRDQTYTLALTIPEGYELAEPLRPRQLQLAGGNATYTRAVHVDGRTVNVRRRFTLGQSVYESRLYPLLKRLWDDVVAAEAEPLVLRRAAPAPATTGATGGQ